MPFFYFLTASLESSRESIQSIALVNDESPRKTTPTMKKETAIENFDSAYGSAYYSASIHSHTTESTVTMANYGSSSNHSSPTESTVKFHQKSKSYRFFSQDTRHFNAF